MKTSDAINELCTALSKAQSVMAAAKFDAVNPFFSNEKKTAKYATLAQVWEVCRKPLTDNGLSVIQPVEEHDGGVMVTTRLLHTSGQWIESAITMPLDKRTSQAVGSAISYGRRYSLSAMVGVVADEDDDGHEATVTQEEAKPKGTATARSDAKAKADKLAAEHGMNTADQLLTEAQKLRAAELRDELPKLKTLDDYNELKSVAEKCDKAVQAEVKAEFLKRKGELMQAEAA